MLSNSWLPDLSKMKKNFVKSKRHCDINIYLSLDGIINDNKELHRAVYHTDVPGSSKLNTNRSSVKNAFNIRNVK